MRVLQVVGDAIGSLPNPVALEGHTDSLGFKSSSSGNWDLSTQRALVARKELERFGVSEDRFTRVAGYSDTLPLIREDPSDPRNRRISIILLFPQKTAANLP
jgi:chemotaxis protein MotB